MKQPEPFGKFLLYGQVAVGGMAEIYKARYADPSMPQMDIALKRILPSYTEDEGFVTMFKDEGNIAIRLKHPNIVNIFEVGEVNNDWYIAMEYIYGSDLRVLSDACEKYGKRFTPTQIARIVCETAKALDYAHACTDANGVPLNIVHRDCTPHNIMVTHDGGVKLMDFGIAKAASRATKTRIGTVKGKSSYMSPEQARGRQLDGRSDMFTLGTVAWEMLTGYRLFKAGSDFEILTKVLKSTIIPPHELDANVPVSLSDIIMKTLERDRDMRYATCGELAQALESWIGMNGDGSDAKLGEVCMALTNKKNHVYSELPDYVPGASQYRYEDGVFVPKEDAPKPHGTLPYVPQDNGISVAGGPSPQPQPQPVMAPQQPQQPMPGFPMTSVPMPPGTNRVPNFIVVAMVMLGVLGIAFLGFALFKRTPEENVPSTVQVPESNIQFKSTPDEALVTVNGVKIVDEKGEILPTPIYGNKRHLGDHLSVVIEKEGYEPYKLEFDVISAEHTIDVQLLTPEETQGRKNLVVPKLTIDSEPSGAKVVINGEDKGKTPLSLDNIKYGTELRIEASMEGAEPATRTYVAMRDSDRAIKLSVPTAAEKPARVAVNTEASKPAAPRTVKKAATPKPAAKPSGGGEGKVTIKAVPWGFVSIDGKRIGNTPKTETLKAGTHKIEINLPNKNLKVSKSITVKGGQAVSIGYDFNAGKWL